MENEIDALCASATAIVEVAGRKGKDYFLRRDELVTEQKGPQDFVSEADREVEHAIRARLGAEFPDDAIVGEEHGPTPGVSGFTWVIDPIDGTTNFINGIPAWTVVLAGVKDGRSVIGIIHDPMHGETYVATRGGGARLNGGTLWITGDRGLRDGTVGVGMSNRTSTVGIRHAIDALLSEGSLFYRNASGALSLAYVAAGRLLGYVEEHMNAWDCLAGQLIVEEAGGLVEPQNADDMIARGGRVVVGSSAVFPDLVRIADAAFSS